MIETSMASGGTDTAPHAAGRMIGSPEVLARLRQVVFRAASKIQLYRRLYGSNSSIRNLAHFKKLPTTSPRDYGRLLDVIDSGNRTADRLALAPWYASAGTFPITTLLDAAGEAAFEDRAAFLLKHMHVPKGQHVTFLVDDERIYPASDLADVFIYLGYPAQLVLIDRSSDASVYAQLASVKPHSLIICAGSDLSRMTVPKSVACVVTFNQRHILAGSSRHLDVFHLDEAPLIALAEGDGNYYSLFGHFLFEQSEIGTLMLTTLRQDFMPFIRYDTGIQCVLADEKLTLHFAP